MGQPRLFVRPWTALDQGLDSFQFLVGQRKIAIVSINQMWNNNGQPGEVKAACTAACAPAASMQYVSKPHDTALSPGAFGGANSMALFISSLVVSIHSNVVSPIV
jgi:hypothetical protein